MEDGTHEEICNAEPKERFLTPDINQYKLMPVTSYLRRLQLTMDCPSMTKYFFFQVSNHNSPEGKTYLCFHFLHQLYTVLFLFVNFFRSRI